MTPLIVISYLCGIAALVDMYRRPLSDWQHADRDRGYWATIGVFLTLFVLGLVFALSYLMLVVGRFSADSASGGDFPRNDFGR